MNPLKKLAGQTAIYGLPTIIGRFLNYLLVPLYTYTFSPTEFGVVTELYAYVSFLLIILTYGMETALFRFANSEPDPNKVYTTSLVSVTTTSIVFFISTWLLKEPLTELLNYEGYGFYITCMAAIIALDAITAIPFSYLRFENKAKKFAVIRTLNILVNLGLNVVLIGLLPDMHKSNSLPQWLAGLYDPSIGVGYIFIANLIASGVSLLLLWKELFRISWKFDKELLSRMLVYAYPLLIAGLAGMVNETLDRILIKYLVTDEKNALHQLGVYGACYKISIIMTIFIQTFRFAAEPFFFSRSKEENSREMYAKIMKYFVIACALIFLGTLLYIDFIKYFVGEKYREGIQVVPYLLLANLFLGIFYNLSMWYKLSSQTKYGAYLTIFGATITIVANILWIPEFGYLGAAYATLLCYFSMAILSYYWGQKHYPIPYDIKRILFYLLFAIGLYLISILVSIDNDVLKYSFNTLLIFMFACMAFVMEVPSKYYLRRN